MRLHLFLWGLGIWIAATVGLRLAGQNMLHSGHPLRTVLLFVVSFAATAQLARGLCRRLRVPRDQWPAGAIALLLPTLLLDPFSSAFFPVVFPNIPADAAGLFGGWMLCCCAGALVGAVIHRQAPATA